MAQLVVEDPGAVTPSGRLYVSPDTAGPGQPTPPTAADDPWASFPTERPSPQGAAAAPTQTGSQTVAPGGADEWAGFPTTAPKPKTPSREYGTGETLGRGVLHGASMGLEPAIEGAGAEANADIAAAAQKFGIDPNTAVHFLNHVAPGLKTLYGAGSTIAKKFTGNEAPAYDQARAKEAQANQEASEQHPYAYGAGDIAGALAVPLPGLGAVKTGAPLAMRAARGMGEGMIGGGAFSAGNAVGEGEDARGIASDTAGGVAGGGLLGGAFGAAFGRRPAPPVPTTVADRAAQTAEILGAPLPRGVTSNSPMVRATTAKVKEVPFAGEAIGNRVFNTQEAVANHLENEATQLAGGAPTRTTAAPGMGRAIDQAIEHNNAEIDSAYNGLRGAINPDQHFPMPNLQRAISQIGLRRARAGWQNPMEGLQQAVNVADNVGHAGGFNGVHRLRRDLREAGNPLKPNPGYDAGDFRALKKAVDADLRAGIRRVAQNPNQAESLFKTAEMTAQQLIPLNETLQGLSGQKGEAIVGALLNSTKEKTGNIQLLREVRQRLDPAAFDRVAGVMLHELGMAEGQVGEFSLARFVTNWNKVSDPAKAIMFSPAHRAAIDNIVNLGNHLKEAGRYTNNSHTGSIIVLLDIAKDVALLAHDMTSTGTVGAGVLGGAATTVGMVLLTKWLASPTAASSMSRWTTAYRALTLNQPAPARIAAFKVATRNLSNNIHVPFDRLLGIASNHLSSRSGSTLPAQAGEPDKEQASTVPRPRP